MEASDQTQVPDPATPAHEHVEEVHEQQAENQQQAEQAEREAQPDANPVVGADQPVSEPGKPRENPVVGADQPVTEPGQADRGRSNPPSETPSNPSPDAQETNE